MRATTAVVLLAGAALCADVSITSDITTDTTWFQSNTYLLNAQVRVQAGVTLTIQAGTTIKGAKQDSTGKATALIILQGGRIEAKGTASEPITFTTQETVTDTNIRGLWGGLVIAGRAPTSATNPSVEGLDNVPYGGTNAADDSGILRYVRVWHGGADVGVPGGPQNSGNEINGITLAGVGSGTVVEYCEVAFNLDDGFEMFGGTVNLKYCSAVFCGDDAFDTDQGYQGKMQFLFAIIDSNGHHAAEMDSKTNSDLNSLPRSFPQLYGATFIKANHTDLASDGLMRLREGTGGRFANIIMTGYAGSGLQNTDCGAETHSSTATGTTNGNSLYWSANNVISVVSNTGRKKPTDVSSDCTWSSGPSATTVDPQLQLVPNIWSDYSSLVQMDPRPIPGGVSASGAENAVDNADNFFSNVAYKGAFGTTNWLDGWSWLSNNAFLTGSAVPAASETLCGQITGDRTLSFGTTYYLTCQAYVVSGVTLTIEAGVTIKAYQQDANGTPPALVIEMGGKIIASGTAVRPITMTTVLPERILPRRGTWGGLILLGKAKTSAGTNNIEGLPAGLGTYGGGNNTDTSGILRYVRVWYGGADLARDNTNPENSGNEINGITFGAVGSNTIVENCEVAFNLDDGFEMFGGTVNLKRCAAIFCGDDSFDTDEGYQGRMQYIFALIDSNGNHATEMDSKTSGDVNSQPRSFPQMYGATFIKATHTRKTDDGLMRLREGTGGRFGNIIMAGFAGFGMQMDTCGNEIKSDVDNAMSIPDSLFFSKNNIINTRNAANGAQDMFKIESSTCTWSSGPSSTAVDPQFQLLPSTWSTFDTLGQIDPRLKARSPAFSSVDLPPTGESFFKTVSFKGAFGSDLWLDQWSWLSVKGYLPEGNVSPKDSNTLCGEITSDFTITNVQTWYMTCQVFVKAPAVLTIEAGATIRSYLQNFDGTAPALIIERNAKILALGTAVNPITFTNVLPASINPRRGTWGGLILLGNGVTSKSGGTNDIEGIATGLGTYGGNNNTDNSGTLRYVRVWYGGADVGRSINNPENSGNEINGITFGAVGSGTIVEHCEVAYNKDDGFEMFGGAVNLKWCSSIFNQDDAFDTDEGYQGKMQFIFGLVDKDGNHACEMDSKTNGDLNSVPRSYPQVYGATFIKAGHATKDGLLRLREGTGGQFGNMILTGNSRYGMQNNKCGGETRSDTDRGSFPTSADSLFFSANNVINTQDENGVITQFYTDSSCTWTSGPSARNEDPGLVLVPAKWEQNVVQIDPRPLQGGNAYLNVDQVPQDGFFASTAFKGAFGSDLWLSGLSWLSANFRLPRGDFYPSSASILCGAITKDTTLVSSLVYFLRCQTFVRSGATLTIQPGTTIRAYQEDTNGKAPALIIEQGASINAKGTAELPITFTSVLPESVLPRRGTWGGVIILGKAPISGDSTTATIEGLAAPDGVYGGTNVNDNSGTLRYVRIWYGGADISPDPSNPENSGNEINGLTLGGVGAGSTIDHVEVAYNVDDGFEFFGGTVNVRYLSSIFNGDDQFDMDQGYQGKMQFLFALVGSAGNHAIECDSKTGSLGLDSTPRTYVEISHSTFVGDPFETDAVLRFREGSAGVLTSSIVSGKFVGIQRKDCSAVQTGMDTSTVPSATSFNSSAFYFDPSNYVNAPVQFVYDASCGSGASVSGQNTAPPLRLLPNIPTESAAMFDPRPYSSVSYPTHPLNAWSTPQAYNTAPESFFSIQDYSGAFGTDLWLHQWSWLSVNGKLPDNEWSGEDSNILDADITVSTTLTAGTYYMTKQVYVKDGAVLTIQPGTIIKSYAADTLGGAPALIISQGSRIEAKGAARSPITFTSVRPSFTLPARGTWGGLIILGKANIAGGTDYIEGLPANILSVYGGPDNNDNSGTLRYVRVWYGGADLGAGGIENSGNEINGITFGGVGSGTSVEYCEVAYNLDDGFEFFGGNVNARYLSALFVGDDAFDTDQGYQGKMQFLFAMIGENGQHATEMDSKTGGNIDSQPRSFPQVYGATFVGGAPDNLKGNDALMRLREGTGGRFGNLILTNAARFGVRNLDCGSESRSATSTGKIGTSLFFSNNNILRNSHDQNGNTYKSFETDTSCSWNPTPTGRDVDPRFYNMPFDADEVSVPRTGLDPRVDVCGPAYGQSDSIVEESGSFFQTVNYAGAFGTNNWLNGLSYFSDKGFLDNTCIPVSCIDGPSTSLCGSMLFPTVDCTNTGTIATLVSAVRASLISYSGITTKDIVINPSCGSTVLDYTMTFKDTVLADRIARDLQSNPANVLGSSIVSTYGTPVVQTRTTVTNSVFTDGSTPSGPTGSGDGAASGDDNYKSERDSYLIAMCIFLLISVILLIAVVYMCCCNKKSGHKQFGNEPKIQNEPSQMAMEPVSIEEKSRQSIV
ncbi:hypothetical protein AAMO2058_000625800 [Amorphochlora amoebiformis]